MVPLRGATTIKENSIEDIQKYSIELISEILQQNDLKVDCINTILFSCTKDITKAYPGKYVREYFKLNKTAIMHFNEMDVDDSLPLCIRVLLFVEDNNFKDMKYIYLHGAKNLRKDLTSILD